MRGQWFVAVIEPQERYGKRNSQAEKHVLALPKGNIDPGETPEQAALREVHEETGLTAIKLAKIDDVKYTYTRGWSDGARVFKIVSFFLFRYQHGRIGAIKPAMRREVHRALWIRLDEAPTRLSYGGERALAKKALARIKRSAPASR